MAYFKITANDTFLGIFNARNAETALELNAQEGGYASVADMEERLGCEDDAEAEECEEYSNDWRNGGVVVLFDGCAYLMSAGDCDEISVEEYHERVAQVDGEMATQGLDWIIPPQCRGQIVERAYAYDDEAEVYWRRTTDSSDWSVRYEEIECEDFDPANSEPVEA